VAKSADFFYNHNVCSRAERQLICIEPTGLRLRHIGKTTDPQCGTVQFCFHSGRLTCSARTGSRAVTTPLQPFPSHSIPWSTIIPSWLTASIIQGSAIGPAAYVVIAGHLTAAIYGNSLCKFADDTNLIIPASNEPSRHIQLVSVQNWAKRNNLKLNCDKSCEIVLQTVGGGDGVLVNRQHWQESCAVAAWRGWALSLQKTSLSLSTFSDSWRRVSAQTNYARRVLHCHGLNNAALQQVYRRRSSDVRRQRMARFHQGVWSPAHQLSDRRARRLGYCSPDTSPLMNCTTLRTMNYSAKLFDCRTMYCTHYYHHHPPPHNDNLRHRVHSIELPEHSTQLSDSIIIS